MKITEDLKMIYSERTEKWYIVYPNGKKGGRGYIYKDACKKCGEPYYMLVGGTLEEYCSKSCGQSGEQNPMFGKSHSKEAREKQGESYTKAKETFKQRYGIDHNSKLDSVKIKKNQTIITEELVSEMLRHQSKRLISIGKCNSRDLITVACENEHTYKTRFSSIRRGYGCIKCFYDSMRQMGIEDIPLFKRYYKIVDSLTKKTYRKHQNEINPNKYKRGWSEDDYHLDHMFSISEGFKNNVPPFIISSVVNLRMIPCKDNLSKGRGCSITKEELFRRYYEN